MSNTYRIFQYDYAGYYHGIYQDIPVGQGYQPGPWTIEPVPTIPDGQFAVFNGVGWFLTSEQEPPPPPPPEPIPEQEAMAGPEASGPIPMVL